MNFANRLAEHDRLMTMLTMTVEAKSKFSDSLLENETMEMKAIRLSIVNLMTEYGLRIDELLVKNSLGLFNSK